MTECHYMKHLKATYEPRLLFELTGGMFICKTCNKVHIIKLNPDK